MQVRSVSHQTHNRRAKLYHAAQDAKFQSVNRTEKIAVNPGPQNLKTFSLRPFKLPQTHQSHKCLATSPGHAHKLWHDRFSKAVQCFPATFFQAEVGRKPLGSETQASQRIRGAANGACMQKDNPEGTKMDDIYDRLMAEPTRLDAPIFQLPSPVPSTLLRRLFLAVP